MPTIEDGDVAFQRLDNYTQKAINKVFSDN